MADLETDERTVVAKSSFDVANVIIAIAILIAVLGCSNISTCCRSDHPGLAARQASR